MGITCPYSRCLVFRLSRQPTGCAQVVVTCFFGSFIRPLRRAYAVAAFADWGRDHRLDGDRRNRTCKCMVPYVGGRRKPFGGLLKANADLYNLHLGAVIIL